MNKNEPRIRTSDLYLEHITTDTDGIFTVDQLAHACMDIFIAGSETTSKSQEVRIDMND